MASKDKLIEKAGTLFIEFQEFLDASIYSLERWLDDLIHKEDDITLGKILGDLRTNTLKISERTMFSTLEEWVENYRQSHATMGLVVTYNELGNKVDLDKVSQHELTCVLQETCRNAIKHGNAGMIQVLSVYGEESLKITVADNGLGIDTYKLNNNEECGAGVINMKSRLAQLGGAIEFMNRDEETGAVVVIDVPLEFTQGNGELDYAELLGKELHDILCPEIIGVSMIMANYKNRLTEDEAELWYQLQRLERELAEYVNILRTLSHELMNLNNIH